MISKTNQLEIRQLRYFIALSDTLHYRKAAENLFISQSALSQQIMLLEESIGIQLFNRSNRKVVLNEAGILFLIEAKLIVNQLEKSLKTFNLKLNGAVGVLTIGFVGSAIQNYLPKLLKKLKTKHPNIELQLRELNNLDQLKALENGSLDIGFMRSNKVPSSFNIRSVYSENFALILPKNHILNNSNFENIGQLRNESFILFPNNKSQMYYQQILNLCASYDFIPDVTHQSLHSSTIFKMVELNMGIALIPNSLCLTKGYKVNCIELTKEKQKTELFAVWNKENNNPVFKHLEDLI